MTKKLSLQVSPQVAATDSLLKEEIRQQEGLPPNSALYFKVIRRSIDARGRQVRINLSLNYSTDAEIQNELFVPQYQQVHDAPKTCHIVGAGPAGLFAALRCLELGIKPVLIERGKDVKARRRDLAAINKAHLVNPESNYCFGEGGAGTYSDGKLYTRSNKRGDIEKILNVLVYHGASPEILVEAHPHIGTNKLPQVIQNIRQSILQHGGELHFNHKLLDFTSRYEKVCSIVVEHSGSRQEWPVQRLLLATGHSARDIYELLYKKKVVLEAKAFAMGVRAEHPQELIDRIQYHCRSEQDWQEARRYLPAASYSLVQQVQGRGVYSFCMCPGGIIAPCATAQQEVVTNGWSPSKRNNPFANSGIVMGIEPADLEAYKQFGPLAGLEFQKELEYRAWNFGGQRQTAPGQALLDFVNNKTSAGLPACSYQPGVKASNMQDVLGKRIGPALREAFKAFGQKMKGYLSNEALIVGVESRTSTPVRIPRDKERLSHPQFTNLYPCGEGAGYAGGIMSAAMDGERCVNAFTH